VKSLNVTSLGAGGSENWLDHRERKIKKERSDLATEPALEGIGGGAFTSKKAFKAFCKKHGIRRPLTAPYSPQQNSVAERKNRIILNMARSMLKGKNMPQDFWAEAIACAVYLLNPCPKQSVWNKTQQEAWSGHRLT